MATNAKTYLLATRPQFFTLSLVGIGLGIALQTTHDWLSNLIAIAVILFIHAGANLINDVADEHNGTDRLNEERISPLTGGSRFIQNQWLSLAQVRNSAYSCFAVAILGGLYLCYQQPSLLGLGVLGTLLAWGYSAPPLQLNSRGIGELALFIAFGLIPFGLVSLHSSAEQASYCLAAYYGLQATAVLFLNQYPDRKADQQAGKHHLVVRLGAGKASTLYLLMLQLCFGLLLAAAALSNNWVLLAAALPLIAQLWCLLTLWKIKGNSADMRPLLVANIAAAHAGPLLVTAALMVR